MMNTHGSVFSESSGGLVVPVPRRMIMIEAIGARVGKKLKVEVAMPMIIQIFPFQTARPPPRDYCQSKERQKLIYLLHLAVYQQHYSNTNACNEFFA